MKFLKMLPSSYITLFLFIGVSYTQIISYQISEKTAINLTVLKINGQTINLLVDRVENSSRYCVFLNGKDYSGSR